MVHNSEARFKVLAAGRRWGKTRLGVYTCLDVASQGKRAWWVAPTYKMGAVGWRPLQRMGYKIGAHIRRSGQTIKLPNGGEVTVRSADDPNSLRGEGLDFVVLDECAYMREEAWTEAIRPALSDRQGHAMFISTPKGRNWFWRIFQLGTTESDWESWQLPTSSNPYVFEAEIATAQATLPEMIFKQEYLAEFLEDSGAVFRNIQATATADRHPSPGDHRGHDVYFGVDWGKQNDFTVIVGVCSICRTMILFDRFNQIDYAFQSERLDVHRDRWKPKGILPERNSMGEPIIEQLLRKGMPILTGHDGQPGFMTLGSTKPQLVEDLALAIEKQDIRIMNEPILISELLAFERELLPSGKFRYQAPDGLHDDSVISLALAWRAATTGGFHLYSF